MIVSRSQSKYICKNRPLFDAPEMIAAAAGTVAAEVAVMIIFKMLGSVLGSVLQYSLLLATGSFT